MQNSEVKENFERGYEQLLISEMIIVTKTTNFKQQNTTFKIIKPMQIPV